MLCCERGLWPLLSMNPDLRTAPMEGQRVRVVLELAEEPRLSDEQPRELWQTWVEHGPHGPIDDDTDVP